MTNPWADLALFDWVLACGSTSLAAAVLRTPQSSVSRRFRAFCSSHRLNIHRSDGRYQLIGNDDYLQAMRHLAQLYRLRAASANWALSQQLNLGDPLLLGLPGQAYVLPGTLWGSVYEYCQLRLIDLIYIPDHVDPLDGLPFSSSPLISEDSNEHDSLLTFRRRLHQALKNLSAS